LLKLPLSQLELIDENIKNIVPVPFEQFFDKLTLLAQSAATVAREIIGVHLPFDVGQYQYFPQYAP
jgi:hypothetical protein